MLRRDQKVRHIRLGKVGTLLTLVPRHPGESIVWVVDVGERWVSHWREEDCEVLT